MTRVDAEILYDLPIPQKEKTMIFKEFELFVSDIRVKIWIILSAHN